MRLDWELGFRIELNREVRNDSSGEPNHHRLHKNWQLGFGRCLRLQLCSTFPFFSTRDVRSVEDFFEYTLRQYLFDVVESSMVW